VENIKHKFSFSDQNLGKETDVSANSGCGKFKSNQSTLQQIKGESKNFCALYFFSFSTPTLLDTAQVRFRMNFPSWFTTPHHKK
jgi:hypothetical protein